MGILIDKHTKILIQGVTGRDGSFHLKKMLEFGTKIIGGVTPGKGGQTIENLPVFNTVEDCVSNTGAEASVIFVAAPFAADAMLEAIHSKLKVVVCITEGVPIKEMLYVYDVLKRSNTVLIGPNCPGLVTVGESKLGIMPAQIFEKGPIGIISRSGTLTYEVVNELSKKGLGQTSIVGIGGDPVVGSSFVDVIKHFEKDPLTKFLVIIGEIGGSEEEVAADYIKENINIPVVAFISGKSAPKDKRMGHAGAIISGGKGTAESKVKALQGAGCTVVDTIEEIVLAVKDRLP